MKTWNIEGGTPLCGEISIDRRKNSVTKLMVLSMLTQSPCVFSNAPNIGDSQITQAICERWGRSSLCSRPTR